VDVNRRLRGRAADIGSMQRHAHQSTIAVSIAGGAPSTDNKTNPKTPSGPSTTTDAEKSDDKAKDDKAPAANEAKDEPVKKDGIAKKMYCD
jgi:hypothetical protein